MNNLAGAYRESGKLDLALPLYEETLKLRKAKLGPDHPETLSSMGNLAMAFDAAGKLDLALPLYEETFKLMKAKLGSDHPNTLTCMGNLADAYKESGKLDLALPLLEETLKLKKAKLGPDHPSTLTCMNNLAGAYLNAGKLDLALPLYEETFKLMKAKLGPDHPNTLTCMGNLADAYQDAGRLDLALPLVEETLKLRKAKLGPEHPDTLKSMGSLAAAYWRAKQLDKSIPMFEDTLKRQETKLGRQHPDTLATVANLGVNYKDAGRLAEALPLLEEGYRGAKKHPPLRWVSTPLLAAYVQAGKAEKAAALAKNLPADARKQLPKESPQLAGQLAPMALSMLQAKAFAEAESLLRECLAIREKTQPDEWTTFNTNSMLGGALSGQKKYAEAEPLLLAGYEGMKQREAKIPPAGKVRLTEALERLVQVYEAMDKKDEAAKWRSEFEKYSAQPIIVPNLSVQTILVHNLIAKNRLEEAQAAWQASLLANPPDHDTWYGYAEFSLFLGRNDEYFRNRHALLQRFGDTKDLAIAERVARACLLLRASGEDLDRAAALADRAVTIGQSHGYYAYFMAAKGLAEYRRGHFDQAIEWVRKAGDRDVWMPVSRLVLAMAQQQLGKTGEARESLATALKSFNWEEVREDLPDPWVAHVLRREAEALIVPHLSETLNGEYHPKENQERLELAGPCEIALAYLVAARLYSDAFASDPKLADDLAAEHRCHAARDAAMVAAGKGKEAGLLSVEERARWDKRAREWLRADLVLCGKLLESGRPEDRKLVGHHLRQWQTDRQWISVRDDDGLKSLPKQQQEAWRSLWAEVDALSRRAQAKL
jgi:tetratricopeptide (TPR) repeat protein